MNFCAVQIFIMLMIVVRGETFSFFHILIFLLEKEYLYNKRLDFLSILSDVLHLFIFWSKTVQAWNWLKNNGEIANDKFKSFRSNFKLSSFRFALKWKQEMSQVFLHKCVLRSSIRVSTLFKLILVRKIKTFLNRFKRFPKVHSRLRSQCNS